MKFAVVISAALHACAVGGCGAPETSPCAAGSDLASSWVLSAPGVSVEVSRSPYALVVRDAGGREVVSSGAAEPGSGFAALAWSDGTVDYGTYVSPGYSRFAYDAGAWADDLEVVRASQGPDELVVVVHRRGDPASRCVEVVHTVEPSRLRVEASDLSGQRPRAWATAWQSPPEEGFLGFGERFNRTDQRGLDVYSWAEEGGLGDGEGVEEGPYNPFPNGEVMSYYPVPFFISTRGYGFWLDTTYRSEFNLATERDDSWRAWHLGEHMAYELYLPLEDDQRPWPYHLIDAFTRVTGRPMLPPAWTFGPRRRVSRSYQVEAVPEIEAMRAEDLAITAVDDSMHFYPSGHHIGAEVELTAWVAEANALGYKVNGYYNSFVDQDRDGPLGDHAAEGDDKGYFLKLADGSYPNMWIITGGTKPDLYIVDFTSEEATTWYQDSFSWATDLGYSGWMYDFGEYVPAEVVAADGTSGEALHNLYPVLYARAAHDALEDSPLVGDWLAFMRSGYTGASAYVPMVWTGDPAASFEDADGLPSMVPASLNLGISGVPHSGGDIGGFHCTADGAQVADEELLTRWIQQGAASSNMQDQNACVGGDAGVKASIWSAPSAKDAWRTYARWHTRLFPYLYTLAHRATETGEPTMRHVFLEHPDRTDLRGVDDAYYLGPALYVAPVLVRGAREKTVDLPEGQYLDWRDRTLVRGGGAVTLDAPLDELPLLLRANYLVPMLDQTIDTLAPEDDPEIIGLGDVADLLDVVGLLTSGARAHMDLFDGDSLEASHTGSEDLAGLQVADSPDALRDCSGCYLVEPAPDGLTRIRVSTSANKVEVGGVKLTKTGSRRIRWDVTVSTEE